MLDIERATLRSPRAMPPTRIPDLMAALKAIGVEDVCPLLTEGCADRRDRAEFRQALSDRKMRNEAQSLSSNNLLRFSRKKEAP